MATKSKEKIADKPASKFGFLAAFDKDLEKMDGISTSSAPPRYWYGFGNHVLNRIVSGSYFNGIPQGRITALAGSSGSGKSYIASNLCRSAQEAGAFVLVVDSENALDDEFVHKIGVNTDPSCYRYVSVTTIPQVIKTVSSFIAGYQDQFGEDKEAPPILIVIDSLNMLMTKTELEHYDKGENRGDQGQKNKQLKAMLQSFVQAIKHLNISIVVTSQVYKNQDILNGEGVWIVSDAVKYACSQIVLINKRKLKDKDAKAGEFSGVRMICEGYKTRFTKPLQKVEIEVPYDTGMDPYSGLLDIAKACGVVIQKGSRYSVAGDADSWYSTDMEQHVQRILEQLEEQTSSVLGVDLDVEVETEIGPSAKDRLVATHLARGSDE